MGEKVVVLFDQLGFGQITLNKVAFTLFGAVEVRWYGILITLGIVLAFLYATWRGKRNEGIILDDVLDVGLSTVICGVVGARLYYVLTSLDQFPTFWSVFQIWNGGLGIYGGIIGGCIGILIAAKIKKLNWLKLFDMIAPGVMIAQAVGRWGNFFNGEAYGYAIGNTTRYFFFFKEFEIPSGEGTLFHLFRMGLFPNEYSATHIVFVHPTFLYECLWNIFGFILINLFYKHKRFNGQVALMYFTWYGFGRMFIEGLRTDSLYLLGGVVSDAGIRISQLIGLLCFLVGGILLIVFSYRFRKQVSDFTTERELPVRRRMADGSIVEESAVAVIPAEELAEAATETDNVDVIEPSETEPSNDGEDAPQPADTIKEPKMEEPKNGIEN